MRRSTSATLNSGSAIIRAVSIRSPLPANLSNSNRAAISVAISRLSREPDDHLTLAPVSPGVIGDRRKIRRVEYKHPIQQISAERAAYCRIVGQRQFAHGAARV